MKRSPEMSVFIEEMSNKMFGRGLDSSINTNTCVSCGKTAIEFKDALSAKEYTNSGLCQICQNEIWGQ